MKIKQFSRIILCSLLIILFFLSTNVLALTTTGEVSNEITPVANEVQTISETAPTQDNATSTYKDSDLFLYAVNVEMSDTVNGNVFAYGQTVNITGQIYGDLFVCANSLTISENAVIHGNIFALANTTTISGLASDVYLMSNNLNITSSGMIARNLYVTSSEVTIAGQISRDVNASVNNLHFEEGAIVKGNLNYTSENEFQINDGIVSGEVNYTKIEANAENMIWSVVSNIVSSLLFSFVIIMLLIWIAPKFKDSICEIIEKKSLKAFGIGLLVFFGTIIASFVLLVFTYGFGASIAVFAIVVLTIACIVATTIFSMAIGQLITNKTKFKSNTAFVLFSLLVVLVLKLVGYIPYIGTPIGFIVFILGLGIICMNAYKRKDLISAQKTTKT